MHQKVKPLHINNDLWVGIPDNFFATKEIVEICWKMTFSQCHICKICSFKIRPVFPSSGDRRRPPDTRPDVEVGDR